MSELLENEEALIEAVRDGDLEEVLRLLSLNTNINVQDDCGWTPLHHAVRFGHTSVVAVLLQNGANPNAKAKMLRLIRGDTPLYLATSSRIHEDTIQLLVSAGADLNSPDANDNLPLHLVVKSGLKDLIALLIAHGADVNSRNSLGFTPLRVACHDATWCKPDVVELLLQKGAIADFNEFEHLIKEASCKAERNHRVAIMQLLEVHQKKSQPAIACEKIRFSCPQCGGSVSAPISAAGKTGKCPKCLNKVGIPSE